MDQSFDKDVLRDFQVAELGTQNELRSFPESVRSPAVETDIRTNMEIMLQCHVGRVSGHMDQRELQRGDSTWLEFTQEGELQGSSEPNTQGDKS